MMNDTQQSSSSPPPSLSSSPSKAMIMAVPLSPLSSAKSKASRSKSEKKRLAKQMKDMIKKLKGDEEIIKSQTTSNQLRQQTLLQSQRQLEEKIVGIDKNHAAVKTQLTTIEDSVVKDRELLKLLSSDEVKVLTKVEKLQEQLRALSVKTTESREELARLQEARDEQEKERATLLQRSTMLQRERTQLSTKLTNERRHRISVGKRLEDITANLNLIRQELDAMEKATNEGKGRAVDRHNVNKQAAALTRTQSEFQQQVQMSETRVQQLEAALQEVTNESEQIGALLPTLALSFSENHNAIQHKIEMVAKSTQATKTVTDTVSSLKQELSSVQKAIVTVKARLETNERVQGDLVVEDRQLQENKHMLKERVKDLRHGDESLLARIRQDALYLEALRKKIDRIVAEREELVTGTPSATLSPLSTASRSSHLTQLPARTSSAAVTVHVRCLLGKKLNDKNPPYIDGTVTITSYLVIFEGADGDPHHSVCVDIQDVAGIRQLESPMFGVRRLLGPEQRRGRSKSIDETSGGAHGTLTSNSSGDTENKCLLSLAPNYQNRFFFNQDENARKNSVFGNDIRFGGSKSAIESMVDAVLQSLLYHENRLLHMMPEEDVPPRGNEEIVEKPNVEENGVVPLLDLDHDSRQKMKHRTFSVEDVKASRDVVQPLVKFVGQSGVVNKDIMQQVILTTPPRLHLCMWTLAFDISTDGTSINTFYSKCQEHSATLILIEDSKGTAFGGFTAMKWRDDPLYYGTGETYVFTIDANSVQAFHWSGRNNFFQLSTTKSIAIGGGYVG